MTKPLTGYEKEIAILHAEARQDAELIFEFKGIANEYKQAIERVREIHKPVEIGLYYGDNYGYLGCPVCDELYPCPTIQALDGTSNET
jgi:hypothetical protein